MLATLLLSQGVPMLLHGDEIGRTQGGNNNVYCQDNETSWIDWSAVDEGLLEFAQAVTRLRAEHPVFRRRRFFTGEAAANGVPDIAWLSADGHADGRGGLGAARPRSRSRSSSTARAITEPGLRGEEIADDSFLLLLNPHHEDAAMTLPGTDFGERVAGRARHGRRRTAEDEREAGSHATTVGARSLVVLRHA